MQQEGGKVLHRPEEDIADVIQNAEDNEHNLQSDLALRINFCNVSVRVVNLPITLSENVFDLLMSELVIWSESLDQCFC